MNAQLTTRETEVLRLLSFGYSQKEIADQLSISGYTVDVHVKNIKEKTGLHKSTELTAFWYVKSYHIPVFNMPERLRQLMAGAMLALSVFITVLETNVFIRVRTSATRNMQVSRRPSRRETDYYLLTI